MEMNLRGFHLWRSSTGQRADAVQITPTLIYSRGSASTGAEYQVVDPHVTNGTTYTYWLQEVETTGAVVDADVTVGQLLHMIFLPLVER